MLERRIAIVIVTLAVVMLAPASFGATKLDDKALARMSGGIPWLTNDCLTPGPAPTNCVAGIVDAGAGTCTGQSANRQCSDCPGTGGSSCGPMFTTWNPFNALCVVTPAVACAATATGYCDGFGGCNPPGAAGSPGCGTYSTCAN